MAYGWLSSVASAFKKAKPIFEGVGAVAGAVGAVAPLVMQATQKDLPGQPDVKSADQLEQEASEAATDKRRELARRKGAGSTRRTTKLGVTSDVYSRRTGIGGY